MQTAAGMAAKPCLATVATRQCKHTPLAAGTFIRPFLLLILLPCCCCDLQQVVDEVYQLLQQQNLDWQQLRTWVRQLQQHSSEHLHDAISSSSSSDSTDEAKEAAWREEDHDVRQLMLVLAQKQQSTSRSKRQNAAVTSARRSIRGMLRPLAIECCN